ncbi:serine/threonine-protein kinase HipA [Stigmatella aurantiaca]|uniref:Serine/threonine-protein kinase HipA n=1 Tax=Stigmatella aurantiaca TaxID=41 RepID=A0A1H7LDG8_STIAU|nr:type II toxin-antitoxin system HipA family toxin [Stigmatella aurantiaca]SEK96928.1 serine/threonine-protein kinase HipA [Stigmatella aurantiaca]
MRALIVRLGQVSVGLLEQLEEWEYRFSFDPLWLRAQERGVLGQLFEDRKPHDIATTGHVPIWFSHLLPQGPLRRAVARQLAIDVEDEFDLLEFLGGDLPGAVVMVPGQPRLSQHPLPRPRSAPALAEKLKFSLAGAQWKLSVRPGERGLTMPVRKGETGSWIAKFHDPTFKDLPRVEFATMRWAHLAGVAIPAFRQAQVSEFEELPEGIPTGDGTVFLIERFDRGAEGQRIHIEDLAQVLDRPPGEPQYGGRYEHIAAVLSYAAPDDLRAFCERLVFCVLCGNTDAHLKNWSLIYPDGRTPRLSPAYDLISSVLYAPEFISDELALSLNHSRRFEDVDVGSFRLLAEISRIPFDEVASWVRQATERVRTIWQKEAVHLPWTDVERQRLERHLARVPLASP